MQHRIGVISDTHIPHFKRIPEAVWQHFADVELIIHAGDLSIMSVIDQLETIAPVEAVQGNIERDEVVEKLPIKREIMVRNCRIGIVHILLQYPLSGSRKNAISQNTPPIYSISDTQNREGDSASGYARTARQEFPKARIVVFGHSHNPYNQEHNGQLLFNPGSATDRRRQPTCSIGKLYIDDESNSVRGEIIPL